jgi:hypothetical protein
MKQKFRKYKLVVILNIFSIIVKIKNGTSELNFC